MVKAILFDIDNTLYDSAKQSMLSRKNAVKAMIDSGLDVDMDRAIELLNEIVDKHGSNYENHFDEMMKVLGVECDSKIIASGVVAYHNTTVENLIPEGTCIETLQKLRKEGYKLGVITNGKSIKQWEKLIRLGLGDVFDVVAISEEAGCSKPEPGIFISACDVLGVNPDDGMYVGDRLDSDIEGAHKAGMKAVYVYGMTKEQEPENDLQIPDHKVKNILGLMEIL